MNEAERGFGGILNRAGAAEAILVGGAAAAVNRGPQPRMQESASGVQDCRQIPWLRILVAVTSLLVAVVFVYPLARPAPALRATVETMITLMGLVGAGLFGAQFVHTRQLRKLLLLVALLVIALTEFVGGALPAALQMPATEGLTASLPVARLFIASILAAAAFTPSDRLIAGGARRPLLQAVLSGFVAFAVTEAVGLLLYGQLPVANGHGGLEFNWVLQHPLGLIDVLVSLALLSYAAIDFLRRGRREGNVVASLLAAGVTMLAVTQLYDLRLPGISTSVVSFRAVLDIVVLGLFLAAAVRAEFEIRASLTRVAALAERRRVAQDLHDGLAQDLALIGAHAGEMASELGHEHPLAVAARHALALSRETITGLSDMSSTSPDQALKAIAYELGQRFGIGIAVHAQADAAFPPDASDHIGRIVREAIANAARHGHAHNVIVSLTRSDVGLAVRVCDDGRGVGGANASVVEGFGLRDMHDRAAALGGHLTVRQRRAGGTELEVVLP